MSFSYAQISGNQLLDKAIEFHDPNGNWKTFNGILPVTMETPSNPDRNSIIHIDLPNEFFMVNAQRGGNITRYTVHKGKCGIQFNGTQPTEAVKKKNNLSCDRANWFKDDYTY